MKNNNLISDYVQLPIYDISQKEKSKLLLNELNYLTQHHYENCEKLYCNIGNIHTMRESLNLLIGMYD